MKKEELIEAMADAPDCLDIEVAVKGDKADNTIYRRVIKVERRHREDIGRDVISLICLKSLKDEKGHFAAEDKARRAERKKIISDAALLDVQREQQAKNVKPQDQRPQDQQIPKGKNRKKKAATDNGKGDKYDSAFDLGKFGRGAKKSNTFADLPGLVKEQLDKAPGDYDSVFDNLSNTFNDLADYEIIEETPKNDE